MKLTKLIKTESSKPFLKAFPKWAGKKVYDIIVVVGNKV
jgi:hypothetical protein